MRKILFIIIAAVFSTVTIQAQTKDSEPYKVYCELTAQHGASGKIKVWANFGDDTPTGVDKDKQMVIVNSKGEKVNPRTLTDAANYLGKYGWKLVSTHMIDARPPIYYWVMGKTVKNVEEIKEGIIKE